MRPPTLSELETLVLALEEGSIARAAARLRISGPAAAKRIRRLEALARQPLLIRGARGVTATDAGARLYPVALELLSQRGQVISALLGAARPDAARAVEDLAKRFCDAVRHGEPKRAEAIAEEALERGADVPVVHAQMIDPAMKSIGDLWAKNAISVDEEHLATEISQAVAARIYSRAQTAEPCSRERVLMAAVQGERHVLGLRLASDVLEGAGYDVLYLGADLPLEALVNACHNHRPQVVGLTVSLWLNVPTLIWEAGQLMSLDPPPRLMVGGRAARNAVRQGLNAALVDRCDRVLEKIAELLAAPQPSAVPAPRRRP